jgi:hypothetical protein
MKINQVSTIYNIFNPMQFKKSSSYHHKQHFTPSNQQHAYNPVTRWNTGDKAPRAHGKIVLTYIDLPIKFLKNIIC